LAEWPEGLGSLRKLTYLDLASNNLEHIPDKILCCQSLVHLLLGNNKISDIPENMFSLRELRVINLRGNYVSNLAVTDLKKCDNIELEELILSNNQLLYLPRHLAMFSTISYLELANNCLNELPDTISTMTSLRVLDLRNNALLHLPFTIGALPALTVLDLRGNLIQSLPASVSQLVCLRALWLTENQSRPLPSLQEDFDSLGLPVLTCCLLPQGPGDSWSHALVSHVSRGNVSEPAFQDTSQSEISKLINLRFDNQKLRSLSSASVASIDEKCSSSPCETRGYGV